MAGYIGVPIEVDPDVLTAEALDTLVANTPGFNPKEAHLEVQQLEIAGRMHAETRALARDVPDTIFRYFGESLVNVRPVAAQHATALTTWTMVDNAGYTIDEGTLVAYRVTGDRLVTFETTEARTVPPGSTTALEVPIRALEPGAAANGLGPAGLELIDSLSFVVGVSASGVTSGGVDPETDDAYLGRLRDEMRLLTPRFVLAEDAAVLARRISGVHRALGIDNYNPGVNEIQRVAVGNATDGTFTLTFDGQVTAAIAAAATAADVRVALEALSNIAPGDVAVTGGPLGTAAVDVEFTGALKASNRTQMTATSSLVGLFAAVTIDPNATANNEVRYTAKAGGAGGNAIRVGYTVPAASTALSVAVAGNDITVTLATDAAGAVISTALAVRDAVNAHAGASALVGAALPSTTTGAGVVAGVPLTNLAGGADPTLTITTPTEGVAPSTNNEKMISVAIVGADGLPLSEATCTAVRTYLDDMREMNFIVHIISPEYTSITVDFTVVANAGYDLGDLADRARTAVRNYLSPAVWAGGGDTPPDWRKTDSVVRYLEVAEVLNRVDGVHYVQALTLNGASADVVLAGVAPLPSVASVTGGAVSG